MKTIITRPPAYTKYLLEEGMIKEGKYEVIEHATPESATGKDVLTSGIPNHLAVLCNTITTVPLWLPLELRGQELSVDQVRQYAKPAQTYRVMPEKVVLYQVVGTWLALGGEYTESNKNTDIFFSKENAEKECDRLNEAEKPKTRDYRVNYRVIEMEVK